MCQKNLQNHLYGMVWYGMVLHHDFILNNGTTY